MGHFYIAIIVNAQQQFIFEVKCFHLSMFTVLVTDREIDTFYQNVNDHWRDQSNTTLAHVTVVSTGGGFRDYHVRSGLTSLKEVHGLLTCSLSFINFS